MGSEVSAMKSAAATLEERLQDVVDRTTTTETAGLRQEVALLHTRLEQVSAENGLLRAENGQLRVDMAELRTMVADLIERQRSSAPVPPPPEAEGLTEVEELRRQLLIQEARSSTVERARPPLAHEAKDGAPVPAPRKTKGAATIKTYAGPKKAAAPVTRSATSAAVPAGTPTTGASTSAAKGATRSAPPKKSASTPAPSQPAKMGPGRSREKRKGRTNAAKPAPTPQPRPLPPAPANMNEAWTTVVRGGQPSARQPASVPPSDSSEGEPTSAKYLALAEGPATAAASPATGFDKRASCGLDAASSAQSRAACREAHKRLATVGEVERLERSLTEVGPYDPLRRYGISQKIVSTVATKSSAGLKGDYVRALKSAASSMEEVMVEVLERTKDGETEGLRKSVDLLHARLAQISAENGHLRAENGQMKVDLAELRTLVNDLIEKQCNSAPVPTPLETEEANEAEELRPAAPNTGGT
ncbi:uncharacterized protein LOC114246084 [Bombyx mandarina]|uniref:Uncharacterized protein LOC114246084 n=1 Tax=Bombyx mandarina TaxID=7092 RepID=A0A6J2JZS2_BOMMA|nr:uncharacterized protein LOC114246084 [Bombyx mandarina]